MDDETDDDPTEDESSPCVWSESEKSSEARLPQFKNEEQKDIKISEAGPRTTVNNHDNNASTSAKSVPDWCKKGEMCMALYHADGRSYRAVIQRLRSHGNIAEVTFIGYESAGTEFIPVADLRKVSRPQMNGTSGSSKTGNFVHSSAPITAESLFSPLHGNEFDEQMRSKYDEPDERELDLELTKLTQVKHTKCQKTKTNKKERKRCELPLKVRKQKQKSAEEDKIKKKKTKVPSTSAVSTSISTPAMTEEEFDISWDLDGFDDKDMEKPNFNEPPPHPSVPQVLSPPGELPVIQVPAPINCRLRDYQRDGVRFLYDHYRANTGAILGDDMGLGKTVQVIALMAAILGKTGTKADVFGKYITHNKSRKEKTIPGHEQGVFLIVCPGCVLYNWKEELDTWGYFKVKLYHGSGKAMVMDQAARGKLDVVVTTYDTMKINVREFEAVKWLAAIMDEAHKLKGPTAMVTMAAKKLKISRRFGLTGTPLQNRLSELWCVLDWANPGCLGELANFNNIYDRTIKHGQRHDANKRELALGRTRSKKFQDMLNKWMLRRTKDLIADQLPNKDDKVVFCNMTPFQEDVYVTLFQSFDVQLVLKKHDPCDCGSGDPRGWCCYKCCPRTGLSLKSLLMRCFQLFLKVANHAALLMPRIKQTEDQRERAKALCDEVFKRHPQFAQSLAENSFQTLSDPAYCGKMKVLDKLLRMFKKEKSKVLLFSQSTQLLDILEDYIIGRGMTYLRLDGKTAAVNRMRIVREFNGDPGIFVCLVSTKAGGLGLNFTGANVVIIFDPTWNPSNDLQAQDRAYRIGQRRDVQVLRLISSGTMEEMMYLRQIYKQQMANIAISGTSERRYFMGVEGDKAYHGELFGIENLFVYRSEGSILAKDIIKRTDNVEEGLRVANYQIVPDQKPLDETEDDEEEAESADTKPEDEDEDGYDLEAMASQYLGEDEPDENEDLPQLESQPITSVPESQPITSVPESQPITSVPESQPITSVPEAQPITNRPGPSSDSGKEMDFTSSEEELDESKFPKRKRKPKDLFSSEDEADEEEVSDYGSDGGPGSSGVRIEGGLPSCLRAVAKKAKSRRCVTFRKLMSSSEESIDSSNESDEEGTVASVDRHQKIENFEGRKMSRKKCRLDKKCKKQREVGATEGNKVDKKLSESSLGREHRHGIVTKTAQNKRSKDPFTKIKNKPDQQPHGGVLDPCSSKSLADNEKRNGRQYGVRSVMGGSRDEGCGGKGRDGSASRVKPGGGSGRKHKGSYGGKGSSCSSGGRKAKSGSDDSSHDEDERKCNKDDDEETSDDDDDDEDDDDYNDDDDDDEPKRSGYISMSSEEPIDEFDSDSSQPTRKLPPKPRREKRQKKQRQEPSKKNKVDEILAECGVSYTHANRAVVRATKAESHMSKRAIKDVYDLKQYSQQPANCFATMECSSEESDDVAEVTTRKFKPKEAWKAMPAATTPVATPHKQARQLTRTNQDSSSLINNTTEQIDNTTVFVGTTPRGVRKQHFGEISKALGFTNDVAFARHIVETPESEHRDILRHFYVGKHHELAALKCFGGIEINEIHNKTTDRGETPKPPRKRNAANKRKRNVNPGSDVNKNGGDIRGASSGRKGGKLAARKTGKKNRKRIVYEDESTDEEVPLAFVEKQPSIENERSSEHDARGGSQNKEVTEILRTKPEESENTSDATSMTTRSDDSTAEPAELYTRAHLPSTSILDEFISADSSASGRSHGRDSCGFPTAVELGVEQKTGLQKRSTLQKSILDDFI